MEGFSTPWIVLIIVEMLSLDTLKADASPCTKTHSGIGSGEPSVASACCAVGACQSVGRFREGPITDVGQLREDSNNRRSRHSRCGTIQGRGAGIVTDVGQFRGGAREGRRGATIVKGLWELEGKLREGRNPTVS